MVKTLTSRRRAAATPAEVKTAAPPVNHTLKPTSISVSLTLLRAARLALLAAAGEARTPSIKNQCTDVVNGLEARMGPAVDPDWQPEAGGLRRGRARGFRVVFADGAEQRVRTTRHAAELVGLTPGSLRVALARGGGRYSRADGESAVTVERILA